MEVVLVHCNIVKSDYQQDIIIWYVFASNKYFGQLIDISPKRFDFSKKVLILNFHIQWFTNKRINR